MTGNSDSGVYRIKASSEVGDIQGGSARLFENSVVTDTRKFLTMPLRETAATPGPHAQSGRVCADRNHCSMENR